VWNPTQGKTPKSQTASKLMLSNRYFQTTDKYHSRVAREPVISNNLIYLQPPARMVARNHPEYIPKEREVIEVEIKTRSTM